MVAVKVIFCILNDFLHAAGDCDGFLTHAQFASLSTFSTLSPAFSRHLFQQLKTRKHEQDQGIMDLEEYAKLVLAWNDRGSPVAVRYLFQVFDTDDAGFLTPENILPFVRQTVGKLH